jgi:hypothetical protein
MNRAVRVKKGGSAHWPNALVMLTGRTAPASSRTSATTWLPVFKRSHPISTVKSQASVIKSWPDAPKELPCRHVTPNPVNSSNGPEPENTDRTHQVNVDLTRPSVWSSHYSAARSLGADASVRHRWPDADPTHPIVQLTSSRKSDRTRWCVKTSIRSFLCTPGQSTPPRYKWPDSAISVRSGHG